MERCPPDRVQNTYAGKVSLPQRKLGGLGGDELQAEEGGAVHLKAQVALTGAACVTSMKDAHIRDACAL